MKKDEDKKFNDFFLTFANYSPPENIEKYIESMKNMQEKLKKLGVLRSSLSADNMAPPSGYHAFSGHVLRSSLSADNMAKRFPLALEYKFTQGHEGFETFKARREFFAGVLDQITTELNGGGNHLC